MPTGLAELGWGPIRFRAGLGYTAGNFQPSGSTFSVANWIDWWRAEGWDAPNVAINLGNNDVGFCGADLACNAENVRYLLDAIGHAFAPERHDEAGADAIDLVSAGRTA